MTSIRNLANRSATSVPVQRGTSPLFSLQDEMNRLFSDFFGEGIQTPWKEPVMPMQAITPSIELFETEAELKITVEVPGMDADDFDISLTDEYVTIRGEKKSEVNEEDKEKGFFRSERSYGSFQRAIALPDTADTAKAEAEVKKGVLAITIPKKESGKSKPTKLKVKQQDAA